jgi:hypothetical protein
VYINATLHTLTYNYACYLQNYISAKDAKCVAAFAQLYKITSATPGHKKSVLKNQHYKIHLLKCLCSNTYVLKLLIKFRLKICACITCGLV